MHKTASFKALSQPEQLILLKLYHDYFYSNQNDLWKDAAVVKLKALQNASNMLLCAEDLGMVPDIVENVLGSEEILALQVQRMPKNSNQIFSRPSDAPYLSVVTPSTHDMSTLREWWEEDDKLTEVFCKYELQNEGNPPKKCTPQICEQIIDQHLQSPAMWSVFLLQDILSMDENVAALDPSMERINIPSDAQHVWNYRMHIQLEDLIQQHVFNEKLLKMIVRTNRS
jgi:4-alpha-glucanotransferase